MADDAHWMVNSNPFTSNDSLLDIAHVMVFYSFYMKRGWMGGEFG